MRTAVGFLKEKRKEIVLYAVLLGTFAVVSYLYDIRMDAVEYAFLLSAVWILMSGIWDYLRFAGKHKRLEELGRRLDPDSGELSGTGGRSVDADTLITDMDTLIADADTLIEEDYQRIIERLCKAGIEAGSAGRIARQEMMDYYGMWVHQIKTPIAAMHVLLQAAGEYQAGRYQAKECQAGEYPSGECQDRECQSGRDEGISGHDLEALKQYTKEMKLELFKIEQYVEMVLTYLRMEDMSSDMSFEICELDSVIRQAVRKYSQMFILKKIKLDYKPVETKVLTDEKWLVFVLEQILSNALKYTYSGGISIYMDDYVPVEYGPIDSTTESCKPKCRTEEKKRCLVIEDTGIGICPEDLPRVFEKGFTGYNGRTDKKSTGIGLYLCKSVMDKLHHQMWIESEAGKGTKMYLSLARRTMRHE